MRLTKAALKGSVVVSFACLNIAVAQAEPVTLTGGWIADFSPAMMETAKTSTTVFQFEGSYKMTTKWMAALANGVDRAVLLFRGRLSPSTQCAS